MRDMSEGPNTMENREEQHMREHKNARENMHRMNTYNDHPMGNRMPKGVDDNNRGHMEMMQHKGKVMQQYYGSQQNPVMMDYCTVPFNMGDPRWHL